MQGSSSLSWSGERADRLAFLWEQTSKSAREIAAELGDCTRNAVLGAAHRMGLKPRVKNPAKPRVDRTVAKRQHNIRTVALHQMKRGRLPKDALIEIPPPVSPDVLDISMAELSPISCRWITNEDTHAPTYCGHEAVEGLSWCPYHREIVWAKPEHRRARPDVSRRQTPTRAIRTHVEDMEIA